MRKTIGFRKKFIEMLFVPAIMLLVLSGLWGCGSDKEEGIPVQVSYINAQGTKIEAHEEMLYGKDTEEQLEEMLSLLSELPKKLEYQVPLSSGIRVISTNLTKDALVLNLSEEYKNLSTSMEILTRASFVKSLTQIEGIGKVTIHIDGTPLTDSLGKSVGAMTADMFIDNAGKEISTYEWVTLRLYFANETGDGLIAVDRSKAYNTNISLDKLIVEELIKGPDSKTQGVYPTINPDTRLIGTLVKDQVCYVNFDSTFLKQVYEVDAEVAVYSIVNSLCELSGVSRVQISVDGSFDVMFREILPLTTVFTRDISYMKKN